MTDTPCWRWPGFHRKSDDRPVLGGRYVYRLIWEAANGPLPVRHILHHECETHWCVNPAHLTPMSRSDHALEHGKGGDWGQASKTHCPDGHLYNAENTYHYTRKDGRHERHCRSCHRKHKAKYLAK